MQVIQRLRIRGQASLIATIAGIGVIVLALAYFKGQASIREADQAVIRTEQLHAAAIHAERLLLSAHYFQSEFFQTQSKDTTAKYVTELNAANRELFAIANGSPNGALGELASSARKTLGLYAGSFKETSGTLGRIGSSTSTGIVPALLQDIDDLTRLVTRTLDRTLIAHGNELLAYARRYDCPISARDRVGFANAYQGVHRYIDAVWASLDEKNLLKGNLSILRQRYESLTRACDKLHASLRQQAKHYSKARSELTGLRLAFDEESLTARERLATAQRQSNSLIVAAALVVFLIVMPLTILLGQWIARRVSQINSSMNALAHGQLDTEVPHLESSDEIGDMARSVRVFKENARALRTSEARFRDFARSSADRFWEMDENLRFSYVTDPPGIPVGLRAEDSLGQTRWGMTGGDTAADPLWRSHRETLEAHQAFRDFRYRSTLPAERPLHWSVSGVPVFDEQGTFTGYRGIATDITSLAEAEGALAESEGRFRSVFENGAVGMAMFCPDGRYLQVNAAYAALLEADPVELVGQSYEQFIHPNELADARRRWREAVDQGIEEAAYERCLVTSTGEIRWCLVGMSVLRNREGAPDGVVIQVQDVTEHKRAEDQLLQAQKMEAVGQLTGGIAHDFNNLLAVIVGNLELLEERLDDDKSKIPLVRAALGAGERGAALTHQLLAFSRKQTLQASPVNANRLIEGMSNLLRRALGETIEIAVVADRQLWNCMVDPGQLENALLNLTINARDAMPKGGHLTIETTNVSLDEGAAADAELEPGQYVMLAVTDSGEGMSAEVLEKVFEPFYTTKEVGKGSGLGLSMVYGFVKQSGGHVKIGSEENKGTRVQLYLPRARQTSVKPLKSSPADAPPPARGETILLVEDDTELRSLMMKTLTGLGYGIVEADTGQAALERLNDTLPVDLLLTDMALPGGMSGGDLAKEVLHRRPGLPVIYMSGYTEGSIVDRGQLGEDSLLLQKPFKRAEIAKAIREALSASLACTKSS